MFCRKCGKPMADNAAFCTACGAQAISPEPATKEGWMFLAVNVLTFVAYFGALIYGAAGKEAPEDAQEEEKVQIAADNRTRRANAGAVLLAVMAAELILNLVNFGINFSGTSVSHYPRGTEYAASMIRYMVNDREEAADLAQEAFFKAWQALPTFQGESSFATWVYRLTANLCIDWLRRQKRRQEVEPALSIDDEEAGWTEPADWGQDPQRQLEQAELSQAVARGLEALPDHHRQVLVLRELSGLSYQEIGRIMDLDIGTVKSRIARARMALRKILLADGNLFEPPPSNPSEKRKRKGGEGA